MSMPMHLNVVVVGEKGGVAGIVAAVLRGTDTEGINPRIFAATTLLSNEKSPFFISSAKHKFIIPVALPCQFINPKQIDLWLALDEAGEKDARQSIKVYGPPPDNFYRGVFRDPVAMCGFNARSIPSLKDRMDDWLDHLIENLAPWKKRIWDAFSDSS